MNNEFYGLPVFPFEHIQDFVDINNTEFVLGLGYSQMNRVREEKFNECKERGYIVHTFISPKAIVYTDKIGEGSIIMPGVYIGPYSNIGVGNVIRANSVLSHHDNVGNFNWIADGCIFGGGVSVDNNSFVGLGSTIRNEISIANYTFIGAHSYLSRNTMPESVLMGVPASLKRNIKSLDIINRV